MDPKSKIWKPRLTRNRWVIFQYWLALLILAVSPVKQSFGQSTTSNLRGTVLDASGKVVAGAQIVIEYPAAKWRKELKSSETGQFAATGLRVGGPYSLSATKAGFTEGRKDDVQLKAGNNDAVTIIMNGAERIQVTGTKTVNISQKSTFFSSDIAKAPSVSQDPKDIIKQSPDAYVDGDNLSIGGANNRFNSMIIDGIRQDDSFGLNGNGYPTQRSPISLQAIQEISVERAPFDVHYGNFLGGSVNVVTKSGGNQFEGSVMMTYTGDSMTGKQTKDRKYNVKFNENRLGLSLGGPIIEDKLHYFFNIEGLTSTAPSTSGPLGSGQPFEVEKVSIDDVAQVQEISRSVYGFDAGLPGQDLKEKDLKYLAKLDWSISDDHRLEAKLQKSAGNSINASSSNPKLLPLTSNWYKKTETLDALSLRLFSDWSPALSTKFEISGKKVTTQQDPLKGADFMQAEVKTAAGGSILLGPDLFRQTNELNDQSLLLGTEANYVLDQHLLTLGMQREKVQVYNLFIASSKGDVDYDSIEAFAAKTPSALSYQNAISNNPRDAAADWGYGALALFAQDEWQLTSDMIARFGVRAELYEAEGSINRNEYFVSRYGFANTANVDGKQQFLPRFGLNFKASDKLNLRGGFGLFSGGTPNVWLSNSYTNDGVRIDEASTKDAQILKDLNGRDIPKDIQAQLVSGEGNVDALDPNFKIPQSWKFQTGLDYRFNIPELVDNIQLDVNYTFTKTRFGLLWKDLRRNLSSISNNEPTATAPDGRAIYDTTPLVSNAANEFNTRRGYDMLLTNTEKGYGHTASLGLSKRFKSGFNVSSSYAWQDVHEVNPGSSSRSVSNYGQVAINQDPNDPGLARSNFERKHRILFSTGYDIKIFDQLTSSASLYFERRSGQPYSYTMGGKRETLGALFGESSEFSQRQRMRFYVPKGDGSDVILKDIDEGEFNNYLKKTGLDKYRGQIAPRNAFFSDWVQLLDMRLSQELPGYSANQKTRLIVDVENLPNLLNKKWGQVRQINSPFLVPVADVDYDPASNRYIYSKLQANNPQNVRLYESVWKMQVGVFYDF